MPAFSCAWSLSVTLQRWRSHHSIRHSRKLSLHAARNFTVLCVIEAGVISQLPNLFIGTPRICNFIFSGVARVSGSRGQTSVEAPPPVLVISYPHLFVIDRFIHNRIHYNCFIVINLSHSKKTTLTITCRPKFYWSHNYCQNISYIRSSNRARQ